MSKSKLNKLALLMTGDELIHGQIVDSNGSFFGDFLAQYGLEITEKVTVGDNKEILALQIQRLTSQYDLLIINGGLGPTADDLTASVLAQVSNEALQMHPAAEQHVRKWCESRNLAISKANLKQALLPASATIFPDAPGSACAFYLYVNQCLVIATPGVPSELKHIANKQLGSFLQARFALADYSPWHRYQLFGIGESSLQELIDRQRPALEQYFNIGFRANFPYLELKLQCKAADGAEHEKAQLLSALEDKLLGSGHFDLASSLVNLLQSNNKTIASAESCTGGLIASEITKIAGSSQVYPGSIISYSNQAKHDLLAVSKQKLAQHGAVSAEVVEAMMQGCFKQFKCDYAIAVSGIAGPGGGSEEKPVGTVFIGYGQRADYHIIQLCIKLPRLQFQQLVCAISLDLLRRKIQGYTLKPRYLSRWQV